MEIKDIYNKTTNGSERENMGEIINAKGLGCAEPVILAKNALEIYDEITIIVDTRTALENIRALGVYAGCMVDIVGETSNVYSIYLRKK
jgi:TusA-related sulfurtransferase